MVLVLDFATESHDLFLVGGPDGESRWSEGSGRAFSALEDALERLKGTVPSGIAVVLPERGDDTGRRRTWSAVRAAVSMANALAFAWGVPAVRVSDSSEAADAVTGAGRNARVVALYDGEPNITKPKQ